MSLTDDEIERTEHDEDELRADEGEVAVAEPAEEPELDEDDAPIDGEDSPEAPAASAEDPEADGEDDPETAEQRRERAAAARRENWLRDTNRDPEAGDILLTEADPSVWSTIGQHASWMFAEFVGFLHADLRLTDRVAQERWADKKYDPRWAKDTSEETEVAVATEGEVDPEAEVDPDAAAVATEGEVDPEAEVDPDAAVVEGEDAPAAAESLDGDDAAPKEDDSAAAEPRGIDGITRLAQTDFTTAATLPLPPGERVEHVPALTRNA